MCAPLAHSQLTQTINKIFKNTVPYKANIRRRCHVGTFNNRKKNKPYIISEDQICVASKKNTKRKKEKRETVLERERERENGSIGVGNTERRWKKSSSRKQIRTSPFFTFFFSPFPTQVLVRTLITLFAFLLLGIDSGNWFWIEGWRTREDLWGRTRRRHWRSF